VTFRGVFSLVMTSCDESFAEFGPGHLLTEEVLKDCASRGLREFDFLGCDLPWKMEWTSTVRPHHWLYIFRKSARGRFLRQLKFGWAVAAVDLPLHGVTNTALTTLYQPANEQTFNLDLVVNASGASGSDGVIDPTGTHFINLTYPLASRDNLRQAVVNQLALLRALPSLDLDGDPNTVDIDVTRVAFVGQSLGSITGITFGAVIANPTLVPRMTFSVPGGGVAELLQTSPTFGPRINAGLQAQGLLPGTSLYAQYFRDTQQIVDAGDPLNYVASTAAARTIYFQQVVGATTPPPLPDQVIPNSATARLISAVQAGIAVWLACHRIRTHYSSYRRADGD